MPAGQLLPSTTDPGAICDPATCKNLPRRCLLHGKPGSREAVRLITSSCLGHARERVDAHRLTPWAKRIYNAAKGTVERSRTPRQLHRHPHARFRGLFAVTCQRLLAAA